MNTLTALTLWLGTLVPLAHSFISLQGLDRKQIFHGTSLIVRPDYEDRVARNATATAASFYCYFGQAGGYLSFGW